MIKVDVISGFLGAGKTTLIKKLYEGVFNSERVALIENEFGEIGIDGAFLKDTGVSVKEINSGCICCSLTGNFKDALNELISSYELDRIIIEPSGVGKLSEVVSAVKGANSQLKINVLCTVVDGNKVKMYAKNYGEFYIDQITSANTIVLTKAEGFSEQKIIDVCEFIKQYNPTATLITTPVSQLNPEYLLENLEDGAMLMEMLIENLKHSVAGEHGHRHHHDHHHEHEHCDCDHDHHEHEHCDCDHEHHEHEHCDCEHEHHHEHEHCDCGHEHHEHHEHGECHDPNCHCHHHADEVFDSFGVQTVLSFSKEKLESILKSFDSGEYGEVLRAKGVVKGESGWLYFDYVPGVVDVRDGSPDVSGKICVIGSNLDKKKIEELICN
ncbi:MAG: GTP-binding protein [Clostridia bacterium]|nr:GTP-binding protein [Clostridia bacterium]